MDYRSKTMFTPRKVRTKLITFGLDAAEAADIHTHAGAPRRIWTHTSGKQIRLLQSSAARSMNGTSMLQSLIEHNHHRSNGNNNITLVQLIAVTLPQVQMPIICSKTNRNKTKPQN